MRRFELGETVVIDHKGMVIGKIVDIRGWGFFKEYCVLSTYPDYPSKVSKEQIDWLPPGEIIKSDLVDIKPVILNEDSEPTYLFQCNQCSYCSTYDFGSFCQHILKNSRNLSDEQSREFIENVCNYRSGTMECPYRTTDLIDVDS